MKLGKCSRCGCEGIHACMGENSAINGLNLSKPGVYNRFKDAIEYIRKSEAEIKNNDSRGSG